MEIAISGFGERGDNWNTVEKKRALVTQRIADAISKAVKERVKDAVEARRWIGVEPAEGPVVMMSEAQYDALTTRLTDMEEEHRVMLSGTLEEELRGRLHERGTELSNKVIQVTELLRHIEVLHERLDETERERAKAVMDSVAFERRRQTEAHVRLMAQAEQRVVALEGFISNVMSGERITPDLEKEWAALSPAPKASAPAGISGYLVTKTPPPAPKRDAGIGKVGGPTEPAPKEEK